MTRVRTLRVGNVARSTRHKPGSFKSHRGPLRERLERIIKYRQKDGCSKVIEESQNLGLHVGVGRQLEGATLSIALREWPCTGQ